MSGMSDVADDCTEECAAMPRCGVCGQRKRPRGRSVGLEAENSYCGFDCPGFNQEPRSGHLWPEEWRRDEAG